MSNNAIDCIFSNYPFLIFFNKKACVQGKFYINGWIAASGSGQDAGSID